MNYNIEVKFSIPVSAQLDVLTFHEESKKKVCVTSGLSNKFCTNLNKDKLTNDKAKNKTRN